jgi:DNA-binding CsgD family transcriptional regulator
MASASDQAEFNPAILSVREREILDLAVEGRTDEQIAQELQITTSTVNSYWVRIRGKLGQVGRTELVAKMLRHESGLKYADLLAENRRLQEAETQAQAELAQSRHDLAALRGSSWCLLGLDHAPDALFACEPSGRILYANLRAQYLFAAEPGELETLSLWDLTIPQDQEMRREASQAFFDPQRPPRVVVGIERPYYGYRRDGTNFRGLLIAERFLAPDGVMAVVSVREYLNEVDALIRHLRKPFEIL